MGKCACDTLELQEDVIPCMYSERRRIFLRGSSYMQVRSVAVNRESVVCISAKCGDGVDELMNTIERSLRLSMEFVRALIPYSKVPLSCFLVIK